jgi:host factor-I protein
LAAKHPNRLQNEFLLHLIEEKMLATVSLLGGARLVGTIATFDDYCISLISDGRLQAIYKQEISVISTRAPLSLGPDAPRPKPAPRPVLSRRGSEEGLVVERVRRITPLRRSGFRTNRPS